jgi:hypothetical protein
VDEVIEHGGLVEVLDIGIWIVSGQLIDTLQVALLRALTEAFELDKANVVLIPFERGENTVRL